MLSARFDRFCKLVAMLILAIPVLPVRAAAATHYEPDPRISESPSASCLVRRRQARNIRSLGSLLGPWVGAPCAPQPRLH